MTNTDTGWTDRLNNVMPDNFLTNTADSFIPKANAIVNALINRIGRTIIRGARTIDNPFDRWTDPVMDYGDTIQSIFIGIDTPRELDEKPSNPNPFATAWPDAKVRYAQYNSAVQYKKSINYDQLRMAFTNESEFGTFSGETLDSMAKGWGLDRFTSWKKYISQNVYTPAKGQIQIDYNSADPMAYAESVLSTIKDMVTNKLKFPSSDYNNAGVINTASQFDVVMTTETKNLIDQYLSGVYNLEKLDIPGVSWILIDDFATVASSKGSDQLDVAIFPVGMNHYVPRTTFTGMMDNPENLYTNHWLTVQGTYYMDNTENNAQIYKKTA